MGCDIQLDSIDINRNFWLEYDRTNDGEYVFRLYDEDQQLEAQVEGPDLKSVIEHAFYLADPLIVSQVLTSDDVLAWSERHKVEYE